MGDAAVSAHTCPTQPPHPGAGEDLRSHPWPLSRDKSGVTRSVPGAGGEGDRGQEAVPS